MLIFFGGLEVERSIATTAQSGLEIADLLLMTKHATEKDRSSKTHLFARKSIFEEENTGDKVSLTMKKITLEQRISTFQKMRYFLLIKGT